MLISRPIEYIFKLGVDSHVTSQLKNSCRCWSIWPSLRLKIGKERISYSCVYIKRLIRLFNSNITKLLDLRPLSPSHRLQHWRCGPMCICPGHRARWPIQAWHSWNVHILFLLGRHCHSLCHCLHFPIMAISLYRIFRSFPPLSCHHPSFCL